MWYLAGLVQDVATGAGQRHMLFGLPPQLAAVNDIWAAATFDGKGAVSVTTASTSRR